MNKTEAAEALSISLSQVSRLCSGDRRPSLELMADIEREFLWNTSAQLAAIQDGTYGDTFEDKIERRPARGQDVDSQTVRSVREAGSGCDGVPPLEDRDNGGQTGGLGQGPRKIDWRNDISDCWYPR